MYHDEISAWLEAVREKGERDSNGVELLQAWEQDQISRLIEYLDVVKTPQEYSRARFIEHDFKVFYEQYDARRGFNFRETFPKISRMV